MGGGIGGGMGAEFDLMAPSPLMPSASNLTAAAAAPSLSGGAPNRAAPAAPSSPLEDPCMGLLEVSTWAERNQNLRALLSTLHEVTPARWGWEKLSIANLVVDADVLKAYRRAATVVHPDKLTGAMRQRGLPEPTDKERERGHDVFRALKRAQSAFS